ncbi:MAG TPA: metalloregulator ArsR/SmtB family transcription factor [Vicinamibacteria bacterium]|jgi:ArsR family transcriptional regulator
MVTETKPIDPADFSPCCDPVEPAEAGEEAAQAIALFKALSDDTRLRIVRTMARSSSALCECNIVPLFGLSQSTISYHLKVLREAGILDAEKRGLWAYYRVNHRVLMTAIKTLTDLA